MDWKKEIGNRIRATRQRLHLTQKEFGKRIGLSSTAISSYEIGDAAPSGDKLAAIARISSVTLEWLICGQETPPGQIEKYLPDDEKTLLSYYRQLSGDDKQRLLWVAKNAVTAHSIERGSKS